MKNLTLLLVALLFIAGCAKVQETENEPVNKWNGYALLKSGEIVHTLWAGQHIDVGTVTYGIDDNANFYVTYDCTPSGWLISETHMFAGDKKDMPVNKPGMPKIGKFPNKGTHPNVSVVTYTVPLSELPPYEEPGFVVATHAVVNNPDGGNETAWGEGDFVFSDKGWGWFPFTRKQGLIFGRLAQGQDIYFQANRNSAIKIFFYEFNAQPRNHSFRTTSTGGSWIESVRQTRTRVISGQDIFNF